jgi:HEAT repeat protein
MRSTLLAALLLFAFGAAAPAAEPSVLPSKPQTISMDTQIDGKTLKEWIEKIKDPDPSIAETAMMAVQLYGPDLAAKPAGPNLLDILSNSPDASLRVHACIAFANLGFDDSIKAKAIPTLRRRLSEDQGIVRLHAIVACNRLGADARSLIPELIARVQDRGAFEIRRAAALALGEAGQSTKTEEIDMNAARALYGTFSGPYPDACADVRLAAVMAFGSMGIPRDEKNNQAIINALTHAAGTDKNKAVVIWAHVGLIAHKEPVKEHLAAILAFLDGKDFMARFQALHAIGAMGKEGRSLSAIPALIKVLQQDEKEPVLVMTSAWALGEMGKDAKEAVPVLKEVMEKKDIDKQVKASLEDALEKINGKPVAEKGEKGEKGPK